jgi:hypothetical protein
MLGDIHQPLHMADNIDRGGNDVNVQWRGKVYRLHEVFDSVLLREVTGKRGAARYADALLHNYDLRFKNWQRGDVALWAEETHRLAVQETYGRLPQFACNAHSAPPLILPDSYVQSAKQYLPEQLAKAGARIAAVLNDSLN